MATRDTSSTLVKLDRLHQMCDSKTGLHPGQLISRNGGHKVAVRCPTATAVTGGPQQPAQKAGPGREESAGGGKSGNEFQSFGSWAFRA